MGSKNGNRHGLMARMLGCCLAALLLTACHKDKEPYPDDTTTARTVLVYMAAENSLSSFATYDGKTNTGDIHEMLQGLAALTDNDRLVVYLDNCDPDIKSSIYVLTNQDYGKSYESLKPTYQFDEDLDSADPQTLRTVLQWTLKRCKADDYGIVFWSHSSGWMPSNSDLLFAPQRKSAAPRRTFGIDNGRNSLTSSAGSQMEISDMAKVLAEFPKFDFILFDCCFMQCVEVCYELRNTARYIIGSPAEIPGNGAPYKEVLRPMFADPLDVQGMVDEYYKAYNTGATRYGVLLSVVETSELEQLAQATRKAVGTCADRIDQLDTSDVLDYFRFDRLVGTAPYPDFFDMQGLMMHLLEPQDYTEWKQALDKAVTYRQGTDTWVTAFTSGIQTLDREQFSGVSMFLPLQKYKDQTGWNNYFYTLYNAYFNTAWGKTIWKE